MECPLEIHTLAGWQRIGCWFPAPEAMDRGIGGKGRWSYDLDWVLAHLHALGSQVRTLVALAASTRLPAPVIERCQPRWERLAQDLEAAA